MKKTEIVFLLDGSGSMGRLKHGAIQGFNQFLESQRKVLDDEGQAMEGTFSLVVFNDRITVVNDRQEIREVALLSTDTYVPDHGTALLDAIGDTVDRIGECLAETPEPERPAKVVVVILTDGLENASVRFGVKDIRDKITHQREKYQWEFLYLGANQNAIRTATLLGIDEKSAATFVASEEDLHSSYAAFSKKVSYFRKVSTGCRLNELEMRDGELGMEEVLEELRQEHAKRRSEPS